jgi:hypothetical protein
MTCIYHLDMPACQPSVASWYHKAVLNLRRHILHPHQSFLSIHSHQFRSPQSVFIKFNPLNITSGLGANTTSTASVAMAEILVIAASGISIASLVIQLADSIQKLNDFCDSMKEVPSYIQIVLADVESLSMVLKRIRDDVCEQERSNPRGVSLPAAVVSSLYSCQTSARMLQLVVEELEAGIISHKKWGALKAV